MSDAGFAPAKINLALHVTGQRDDGYHLLDSIVVFADIGDRVCVTPLSAGDNQAQYMRLETTGPFSEPLGKNVEQNLVVKAANLLGAALRETGMDPAPVSLHLEKNLPVASGIGGGSADAAAALRLLARFWQAPAETDLGAIAARLGADVPMCLVSSPMRARGTGTEFSLLDKVPPLNMVLVNPGIAVSTPEVFRTLPNKDNAPIPETIFGSEISFAALGDLRNDLRNDLQAAAINLCPQILDALTALEKTPNCHLARMSGSGATCFGLYDNAAAAQTAAETIAATHPGWWVQATQTGAFGRDRAVPGEETP